MVLQLMETRYKKEERTSESEYEEEDAIHEDTEVKKPVIFLISV
jgi:hypothetical protein